MNTTVYLFADHFDDQILVVRATTVGIDWLLRTARTDGVIHFTAGGCCINVNSYKQVDLDENVLEAMLYTNQKLVEVSEVEFEAEVNRAVEFKRSQK